LSPTPTESESAETRCTHTTYKDDGIYAKRSTHHPHKQQHLYDLHRLGVRRLYCGPSRRMMRPRIMKLAATSGVGAMMRHTALYHLTLAKGQEERPSLFDSLHDIRLVQVWVLTRPQTSAPAGQLEETTENCTREQEPQTEIQRLYNMED